VRPCAHRASGTAVAPRSVFDDGFIASSWPRPAGSGWHFARSIGIIGLRRLAPGGIAVLSSAQHSTCRGDCACTDFGLTYLWGVENASQQSPGPEKAKVLKLKGTVALFLAGTAACMIPSDVSAEEAQDAVSVQGGWAYTARGDGGAVEHVAAEDAAWLLLACSADKRLIVSLIHTEQFPFRLKPSSSVQLRSNNIPTVSIERKSIQNNQIFVDPKPMRHIMPLLMQDDQLVVSIPGQDGAMHNYTFSMQPNDVALRPIRSRSFDF
jgi:hypothetical protein